MLKKSAGLFFFIIFAIWIKQAYSMNLDSIKIYLLSGDYKSAITEGNRLLALNVESDELNYLLGLAYLKNGDYERASSIFENIIKNFNATQFRDEAELGLGDSYLLRGDFKRAEAYYRGLLVRNSNTKFRSQVYQRISEINNKKKIGEQGLGYPASIDSSNEILNSKNKESGNYYIQVGSFSEPANASNLTKKLVNSGYLAYIEENLVATSKTYRVKVGKLSSRQEAEELSKKLIQEGYPAKIYP